MINMNDVQKKFYEALMKEKADYASDWSNNNAKYFFENGYYKWMASLVSNYHTVFEIGTGDGNGTLTLAKSKHLVISIDENIECLQTAKNKLEENGIDCLLIQREIFAFSNTGYRIEYSPISSEPVKNGVMLIEGDILNDSNLINWLKLIMFLMP